LHVLCGNELRLYQDEGCHRDMKCKATARSTGQPCQNPALPGTAFCWSHQRRRPLKLGVGLTTVGAIVWAIVAFAFDKGWDWFVPDFFRPRPRLEFSVTSGFDPSGRLRLTNSYLQLNPLAPSTLSNQYVFVPIPKGNTSVTLQFSVRNSGPVPVSGSRWSHQAVGLERARFQERGHQPPNRPRLPIRRSSPQVGRCRSAAPQFQPAHAAKPSCIPSHRGP
jgi:hypothetical protein